MAINVAVTAPGTDEGGIGMPCQGRLKTPHLLVHLTWVGVDRPQVQSPLQRRLKTSSFSFLWPYYCQNKYFLSLLSFLLLLLLFDMNFECSKE